MKYTVLAVYHDLTGQKFHRRGVLAGEEPKATGGSTPPKELAEEAKYLE
jgi:hypothetical protein